jgi:hypothetical protein
MVLMHCPFSQRFGNVLHSSISLPKLFIPTKYEKINSNDAFYRSFSGLRLDFALDLVLTKI